MISSTGSVRGYTTVRVRSEPITFLCGARAGVLLALTISGLTTFLVVELLTGALRALTATVFFVALFFCIFFLLFAAISTSIIYYQILFNSYLFNRSLHI